MSGSVIFRAVAHCFRTLSAVVFDLVRLAFLSAHSRREADLIDAYVHGGLSESERRAFERRFLTSLNRWSKVQFARALARLTAESAESAEAQRAPQQTLISLIQGWSFALRFAAGFAA